MSCTYTPDTLEMNPLRACITSADLVFQKGWHKFMYSFLFSASINLQPALQLNYCSAGLCAVKAKAKSQVRAANTQFNAATMQKTLPTVWHTVTNCSSEELNECEPLMPQWGSRQARHKIKRSLRLVIYPDLWTESRVHWKGSRNSRTWGGVFVHVKNNQWAVSSHSSWSPEYPGYC